jgi:hypothetical protein
MRQSDLMISSVMFSFEYVPHDFYQPCFFCVFDPDTLGSGRAVLRPQKEVTRPGLRRRIGPRIEDTAQPRTGAKPDERKTAAKETALSGSPAAKSVKKETNMSAYVEVEDTIKEEVNEPFSPSSIVPYFEMDQYMTLNVSPL